MDSGGSKSGCSASSSFDVAFTSENRFCQDTQLRHRKSPRKRLRVTRTLALVIDQLRSSFQRAGDFTPRMRARRNWRSEFLRRYLSDNRRGDNEECATVRRGGSCCRSFVRETPRIYSIGLRSCARNLSDGDDLLNALGAIRNFWRRFRRSIIVRKHWVAQSTASLSTAVSLQERANQQTKVIDGPKSAEVFKVDGFQERNRRDDQLYECIEEKDCDDVSSTSSNNYVSADRFFTPNFDHSPVRKCCEHDRLRVMRKDAQVQTSSRKTARRKQTAKVPRPTNEDILRRGHDEPTFRSSIADFRSDFRSWDSTNRNEESRLSIRFLENKRAEYINKFTAVKRQIEEITATLRETCCSEKSSRVDQENCETYLSSSHDHTNVNPKQDVNSNEVDDEEDNGMVPAEKKSISQEDDEIIGESTDYSGNVERILDVNNETPVLFGKKYLKNAIVPTTNLCESPNDILVCDCMLTIKEMLRPSNETLRNCHKKRAKCRFGKQISFQDQDLRKDETGEFSVGDRSFHEVCLGNYFVAADDENAKVSVQNFATLERPRYQRMIVDEKMGEMAVLNDIKRRIDRDFDDLSSKSENDTEDFLTVPRKNINFESDSQLYRSTESTTSTMIVESQPVSSTETQTRDLVWADTMSELSNKNSTFSMYHSCTQFPSFVSLRKNEDELALEAEDRSVIGGSSYLNSYSNADCYDLNAHSNVDCSRVLSNDHSQSDLSFDRPHDGAQDIAQDTSTSEYTCPNQFLSEAISESRNACDMFGSQEMADKAYDCEYPPDENNEKAKESRAHLEQQYAADTTFETSKSSRHIGSIDSGVFVNSSLIDLQVHENSFDGGKPDHERRQRRVKERELHGLSRTFDFSSDNNTSGSSSCCTDDTLDRRINDVIRDLTKNLVLCERRVRMKLREMRKAGLRTRETRYSPHSPPRACKFNNSPHDVSYDFFKSPRRSCEDERISGVSTPSFMSLPESEIEDHESIC